MDLNDLIPLESGWVLEEALDINNSGQIAGSGKFEGKLGWFRFNMLTYTLLRLLKRAP
jgi:hypothetical protein